QVKLGLLEHGDEALAARISLIRSAKISIAIQTFNWKTDESGRFVLWELLRAVKQRGVEVEILIDQLYCEQDPEMAAFLSSFDPRFRLKFYNPRFNQLSLSTIEQLADLAYDFHSFNVRLHNKLIIVDDHIVITGGRNFSNRYFDRTIGRNYKDRDVLAILPHPEPVLRCFREYWESAYSVPASNLEDIAELLKENNFQVLATKKDFRLNHLFGELSRRANNPNYIAVTFLRPMLNVGVIHWVFDSPEKASLSSAPQYRVAEELSKLVSEARREIFIQSPYVVLSDKAVALFREIKEKNPNLLIVVSTNSLAATDSWTTYAANYKEKRLYLEELGFEMWEFKPIPEDIDEMMAYDSLLTRRPTPEEVRNPRKSPFKMDKTLPAFPCRHDETCIPHDRLDRHNDHLRAPPFLSMHAKSMVIDDEIAFVGSFNLDPRSVEYNTEVGLIVRDAAFARKLRERIERDIAPRNSYFIAKKEGVPLVRIGNRFLNHVSEALPLIDPWPFRLCSSFRLRKGEEPVNPSNPDFYDHWDDVGNFPQLGFFARKKIAARLFKSAAMILKPLL
ncbi:MAG: phospholipase D family protein, partial [Opitutales bacterium]